MVENRLLLLGLQLNTGEVERLEQPDNIVLREARSRSNLRDLLLLRRENTTAPSRSIISIDVIRRRRAWRFPTMACNINLKQNYLV